MSDHPRSGEWDDVALEHASNIEKLFDSMAADLMARGCYGDDLYIQMFGLAIACAQHVADLFPYKELDEFVPVLEMLNESIEAGRKDSKELS